MSSKTQDLSGSVVLGRYRVVKPLARGGMGIVYLARTEGAAGFARPVVIKRIVPDLAGDEATAQAFVREARILANLQHPSIVNVIDFDEEDHAYVMVLEYVHGYNLGQWHRYVVDTRGQLPVDYALHVMNRVLDALHYAHTFIRADGTPMQIVHRDVSPGNVLIDTQGHVKLLDFGIARANEGGEYKTRDGLFKGKLAYSAPEIYEGLAASPRSDVYSAGVVLYQLLAGENPFRGKDMAEIVRRVLAEKVPPISSRREDVSDEVAEALEQALAKDPEKRFPTAAAFAEALRQARTRKEEDLVREFVDDVWNDFNGDMPAKLGLEPLSERDAAWRAATGEAAGKSLSSTPPPGDPTIHEAGPTKTAAMPVGLPSVSPPGSRSPARWAAGGAAVLLGAAGLAVLATRGQAPAPGQSFVVVEKRADEAPSAASEPATEPAASGAAAPEPALSRPAASASAVPAGSAAPGPLERPRGSPAPGATPGGGPDPVALSRTFQRQRGKIESCFASHVKEVDGRPEVSIRFGVTEAGRVSSAELAPAALSGTPLGQCLLGVARATDFGAVGQPLTFTIPITARRVK
jgi:serine/threonine-protein kinase